MRPEVQKFAEAMEARLAANDYKGGWEECSPLYLLGGVMEELNELVDHLDTRAASKDEVLHEAADVANFVMMLADNYQEKGSKYISTGEPSGLGD